MLKRIVKRWASLFLAVVMVAGLLPATVVSAYAAETTKEISSGVQVSGELTESGNGTVTLTVNPTESSSCSGTSYSEATKSFTLSNTKGKTGELSFQYEVSGSGSVTIDGETKTGSGTYTVAEFAAGAAFEIKVTSGNASGKFETIKLTEIKLAVNEEITTTFQPAENGSYTVDGQTITQETNHIKNAQETTTMSAAPDEGYKFAGWYSVTKGSYLSKATPWTTNLTEPQTITAKFIPADAPTFQAGVGNEFADLNEAVAYAQANNQKTIVLIGDGVLPAGEYTIPAGVTLLVPFDDAYTCYRETPGYVDAYVKQEVFRKLTLASGAEIQVNGAISVSAKHSATRGSGTPSYTGAVVGKYGQIELEAGSAITVNNGAKLYAWGYITGAGTIDAKSGSTVYEYFQIADWRGGSATSSMNGNKNKVFPMSQYYFQNIEAPLTLESGASEKLYTSISAGGTVTSTTIDLISGSNSSLFVLHSGTLTKQYGAETDRLNLSVNGALDINELTVAVKYNIMPITLKSSAYDLPITSTLTVDIQSGGSVTLKNDAAFLPGVELNVADGATVTVEKNLYLYDRDEWVGNGFVDPSRDLNQVSYTPEKGSAVRNIRTSDSLMDAAIDLNGSLVVKGQLYTSESGANITSSEGTGKITYQKAPSEGSAYGAIQSGTGISYVSIPVTPAQLKNADESYTQTAGAAAGDQYIYANGKWAKPLTQAEWDKFDPQPQTVEYDGQAHNYDLAQEETDLDRDKITVTAANGKDAGSYDVTFTSGGFSKTIAGGLVIEPKKLTVQWNVPENIVYNGQEQSVSAAVVGLVKGDEVSLVLTNGTATAAGSYTATAALPEGVKNYELAEGAETKRSWEIAKAAAPEITFPTAAEGTYRASGLKLSDIELTGGTTAYGSFAWANPNTVLTAGTHDYEVKFTPNEEAAKNYDFTETTKQVSVTVNKAEPNVIVRADKETLTGGGDVTITVIAPDGVIVSSVDCDVDGITVEKNQDGTYTAALPNPETEVQYTFTVNFSGGGNYTDGTGTVMVTANHGHHMVKTEAKESTCTEPGNIEYWTCQDCEKSYKDEKGAVDLAEGQEVTPAKGHNFTGKYVSLGNGNHSRECVNAGCTAQSAAESCSMKETAAAVDATCISEGKTAVMACEHCAYTTGGETVEKNLDNHEGGTEVRNQKDASCTEAGYTGDTYCLGCGIMIQKGHTEGAALGHDYTVEVPGTAKEATCTEDGKGADMKCSRCDAVQTGKAIPATGHTLKKTDAKEAACTEAGNHEYWTCETCQKVFKDAEGTTETTVTSMTITALGHEWKTEWSSDETNHWHQCTRCDAVNGQAAHCWDNGTVSQDPTCTGKGVKTYTCEDCGKTKTEDIRELGHDSKLVWGEWTEDFTITASFVCQREGCTDQTPAEVTVKDQVTTQPTCTSAGVKTYTAAVTVDGETVTKTASIEKIPHTNGEAVQKNIVGATCTVAGSYDEVVYCTVCNEELSRTTRTGEALGHTYGEPEFHWSDDYASAQVVFTCEREGCTEGTDGHTKTESAVVSGPVVVAATCQKEGSKTYTAVYEGYNETKVEKIPVTAHTEVIVSGKPATCTETGLTDGSHCSVCSAEIEKQNVIPALGHKEVTDQAVEATCTTSGLTEGSHCSVCNTVLKAQEEIPAKGHTEVTVIGKAATCTETGLTDGKRCSVCDTVITAQKEIPAKGHSMTYHEHEAATCTENGSSAYYSCANCGKFFTDEAGANAITRQDTIIEALGHTEVIDTAVSATCTTTGLTEGSHCSVCNTVLKAQEAVQTLGHAWGEGTVEQEATCTEAGTKFFACTRDGCSETKTETIPALGHDTVSHAARPATCTESGWEAYETCNRCDYTTCREISAKGHDYTEAVPNWSWDEILDADGGATGDYQATAVFACSVCGDSCTETATVDKTVNPATCTGQEITTYTATVTFRGTTYTDHKDGVTAGANGHVYATEPAWTWTENFDEETGEPTGYTVTATFTCGSCGAPEERTATVSSIEQKATCTEDGSITYTAAVTGMDGNELTDTLVIATDSAAGHTRRDMSKPATCETDGYHKVVCSVCNETLESWDLSATGHAWDQGRAATNPTCTTDGLRVYTCGNNGNHTWTETIPATGHTGTQWVEAREATCTEAGWDAYEHCSACGEDLDKVTHPATGHHYDTAAEGGVSWEQNVEGGWTVRLVCLNGCEHTVNYTKLDAEDITEATCTAPGVRRFTAEFQIGEAETCSAVKDVEIPAKGHSYGEPTWSWSGYTSAAATFTCSLCGDTEVVTAVGDAITNATSGRVRTYTAMVTFNGNSYTGTTTQTISTGGGGGGGGYTPPTPVTPPTVEIEDPDTPLGGNPGLTITVMETAVKGVMTVTVKLGNTVLDKVDGGVTASVPTENASSGTVAILVSADGTEKVIRKSVVINGKLSVPLDGTTNITIRDMSKRFVDVSDTAWYASAVAFVSSHELFNGVTTTTFEPNTTMNRAMLAKVLHNLEDNPAPTAQNIFSDVSAGAWYESAVSWANGAGIVTGYSNGKFGANDNVSRQDMVVMLWRYAGKPSANGSSLNFSDAGKAAGYAREALIWATENGIINGKGDGRLDPLGDAKRSEVAKVIQNYLIYLAE